ncbi:hypothetical protein D3C81_2141850 [compost metagenome]
MLDQQVVLEVEGVEKRYAMNARAEFFDFCLKVLYIAEVIRLFLLQSQKFFLGFAQFRPAAAGQGDSSRMG